ncbi:hypothetical protein Lepto7375DRAFT_7187 [Leptolyngbya sp. PCC 7375]|nr:hypothetical protein Lepto7375DRAFT_7187 [Leptolyngbya sp. PCC 7375]
MNPKYVFISSPYTHGSQAANVREQHDAFNILLDLLGHHPFAPLFSHYHEVVYPTNYEAWLRWDLAWVEKCDCVLRLPGKSDGADRECMHALNNNIEVISTKNTFKYLLLPGLKELSTTEFQNLKCFMECLE